MKGAMCKKVVVTEGWDGGEWVVEGSWGGGVGWVGEKKGLPNPFGLSLFFFLYFFFDIHFFSIVVLDFFFIVAKIRIK